MDSVCLFFLLGSAGQSPLHQVGQRRWERRPVLLPVWAGRAWFLRREGCELWVPQKHRNQLEGFPSSNKLPSFYVDVGFCQKSIFCIYWDDHMVFPLKFVYIVDYTDGFSNVKPTPHSWNKAHWSWCLSSVCVCVCVCLDSICWKFVQNLCTCLNDRHCFLVLFRCGVFVWSREQVNANLKHWIERIPSFSSLWRNLYRIIFVSSSINRIY